MSGIPLIGRLHFHEYFALCISFVLVTLEIVIRTITLLLPRPIIRFFYRISRNAFNSLSSPYSRRARNKKLAVSRPIAQAHDFTELCELYGYSAEEHVVQTKDGYLLGVHRLAWRRGEEDQRVNAGPGSLEKKVVYLHHGLMMNSEVWVCITEKERCLPFLLVDQGYDVWLGNNRGNKYSKKSMHHAPTDVRFWNFSMDQFAFHDIPDSINYILSTTRQPSLSYIGFSQGTAQAFATLSIHPTLNSKVDVFIALAPAMAPPGLASGVVSSLVKSNPEVLFLAFGRRAILGSATMWQALLYPGIFSWVLDKSLLFLFGWKMANISPHQKLAAYPHLYSFTSTKSVVHWFQIIRNGTFQMYDDEVTSPANFSQGSRYYRVARFPTRNIKTPIVLVYGGSDSLVDIKLMLKELPRHTIAREIQKYEHLDLLWAHDVDKLVFPHVLEALESYAVPPDTKAQALGWRPNIRMSGQTLLDQPTPTGSLPPGYSEDEQAHPPSRRQLAPAFEFEPATPAEQGLAETDDDDYNTNDDTDGPLFTPSAFAHSSRPPLSDRLAVGLLPPTAAAATQNVRLDAPAAAAASSSSDVSSRSRTPTARLISPARRPFPDSAAEFARRGVDDDDDDDDDDDTGDADDDGATAAPVIEVSSSSPSPPDSPVVGSLATDQTVVRSRPEGWWSSTNSSTSLVEQAAIVGRVGGDVVGRSD